MKLGHLLNGSPVIHFEELRSGGHLVLVFINSVNPHHPFVVARVGGQNPTSWFSGDYHASLPEAIAAFNDRMHPLR